MKVFLICVDVDLGYHVEHVYSNKVLAEKMCKDLNLKYKIKKISDLVNIGYTEEHAQQVTTDIYFIEEREVEND